MQHSNKIYEYLGPYSTELIQIDSRDVGTNTFFIFLGADFLRTFAYFIVTLTVRYSSNLTYQKKHLAKVSLTRS
jgi:hypothetical protein